VQVQQHRRAGARLVGLEPQGVQPRGLAGDLGREVDPDLVHALGFAGAAAPGAVAGLEDPFALLLVEAGATEVEQQAEDDGGGGEQAFVHALMEESRAAESSFVRASGRA
jgi:hypothetical protein